MKFILLSEFTTDVTSSFSLPRDLSSSVTYRSLEVCLTPSVERGVERRDDGILFQNAEERCLLSPSPAWKEILLAKVSKDVIFVI